MRNASNYLDKLKSDLQSKKYMIDQWYHMSDDFVYWKRQKDLRDDIKLIESKILKASVSSL